MAKKPRPKDDDLNPDEKRDEFGDRPDRVGDDRPLGEHDAPLPEDPEEFETDPEIPVDPESPVDPGEDEDPQSPDLDAEPPTRTVPAIIEVLKDYQEKVGDGVETIRVLRVLRRESRFLTPEERHALDDEIVKSNGEMRRVEVEKTAAVKKYNGEIAEQRQLLDDAIGILRKDSVEFDVERIRRENMETWTWTFHDTETDEIVDEEDIPMSERQTTMNL